MKRTPMNGVLLARLLMSVVFLLNAIGTIDQSVPAREAIERGIPADIVPALMLNGRAIEFLGGLALLPGIIPQLAALALFVFLVPATFTSHSFWHQQERRPIWGNSLTSRRMSPYWAVFCSSPQQSSSPLSCLFPFLIGRHERKV
jgi:uncharacterized membrane protein YphA (DoxX/SURF4 family)